MSGGLVDVRGFAGLRLDADPWDLGLDGAVRCDDVEFGLGGSLGQRQDAGVTTEYFGGLTSTKRITGYMVHPVGGGRSVYLFASSDDSAGPKLNAHLAYNPYHSGASGATHSVARTGSPVDMDSAVFGEPAATRILVTDPGGAVDKLRAYTVGSGWSEPSVGAGGYLYRYVAAWEGFNRAVMANSPGTVPLASPSTVRFSDPGDVNSWPLNNYAQVGPGDGDDIIAMCGWRELLFVLKRSKAYVFYGVSQLSDGSPDFQWRPVELSSRPLGHRSICSTPYGVLVACEGGMYVSTGGDFQPWGPGEAIRPLFRSEDGISRLGNPVAPGLTYGNFGASAEVVRVDGRVIVSGNGGQDAYVYSEQHGRWARWTGNAFRYVQGDHAGRILGVAQTTTSHAVWDHSQGTYVTGARPALYASGRAVLGAAGMKTLRRTMLEVRGNHASSALGVRWWADLQDAAIPATADLLVDQAGASVARLWSNVAYRGRELGLAVRLDRCELIGLQAHLQGHARDEQLAVR